MTRLESFLKNALVAKDTCQEVNKEVPCQNDPSFFCRPGNNSQRPHLPKYLRHYRRLTESHKLGIFELKAEEKEPDLGRKEIFLPRLSFDE